MITDTFDASAAFNDDADEEFLIIRQLFLSTAVDDVIQAGQDRCYLAEDINSEIVFIMPPKSEIAFAEEEPGLQLLQRTIFGYLIGQYSKGSPLDETVSLLRARARTMSFLLWDHAHDFVKAQIGNDFISIPFEDKILRASKTIPQSTPDPGFNYDQMTINSAPVNDHLM